MESENELINKTKEGDDEAFRELIDEYENLIMWHARRYQDINKFSFEDFVQLSKIGFWEAVRDFEPKNNRKLNSFAHAVISNKLNGFINKWFSTKKREEMRNEQSINKKAFSFMSGSSSNNTLSDFLTEEDKIMPNNNFLKHNSSIEASEIIEKIKDRCSERQWRCLILKSIGYSISEIAIIIFDLNCEAEEVEYKGKYYRRIEESIYKARKKAKKERAIYEW